MLVRLRAASLNHLDLWVRKASRRCRSRASSARTARASPRSARADGLPRRVVINPGLDDGDRITVLGEHMDGTHAELIAVPESNVYPIPEALSFEEAAAFPLVFATAYRMLVTQAALHEGEWVLVWGIGGRRRDGVARDREGARARVLVTSTSDEKLERARELGADETVQPRDDDVVAKARELTDGGGVDVVVETVGEATWKSSLQSVRPSGRISVCGATRGPTRRRTSTGLLGSSSRSRLDDGHGRTSPRCSTWSRRAREADRRPTFLLRGAGRGARVPRERPPGRQGRPDDRLAATRSRGRTSRRRTSCPATTAGPR